MIPVSYRLREILAEFLRGRGFGPTLRGELEAYLSGDAYRTNCAVNPEDPRNVGRYGRAKVAEILGLCAQERYEEAWELFRWLEGYLKAHGRMGMMRGDVYRLGELVAARRGHRAEASRLRQEYEVYRTDVEQSFEALAAEAFVNLWAMPEQWADLEAAVLGGKTREQEEVRVAACVASTGGLLGRWLTVSLQPLVPELAVAAADRPLVPAEVTGQTEDGRLRACVRREADGGVWAWVETDDPGLEGLRVRVGVGDREQKRPRVEFDVRLEPLPQGKYGGTVFLGRWEHLGLGADPWLTVGFPR